MAYCNPAYEEQQVQYPAPIVYYSAPTINYQPAVISRYGPHYERQTSTGLGAAQLVLACISISAGSMAIVYSAPLFYVGIGIWAGAWYLIAGSLAKTAGKDPTDKLITATLVCSVLDIVFGIAEVAVAGLGVSGDYPCSGHNCSYWTGGATAANAMMITVGCLVIISGFWLMVVSARAIDKGSKAQLPSTIPVTYAPQQPEPVYIQSSPAFQPQPPFLQSQPPFPQPPNPFLQSQPPPYYVQQQYPSTSNPQQMMYVGVHQAPLNNFK